MMVEKVIEFDSVPYIALGNPTPEFLQISPLGKVPVLEHDGRAIADSLAICMYLEKLCPEPAFFPEDAGQLAHAMWINQYADALFQAEGPVFVNRKLRPLRGQPIDFAALDEALAKLPSYFSYLEAQLGSGPYFCGEAFTIADLTIGAVFGGLHHANSLPDGTTYPELSAFIERVHTRPSFKPLLDEDALFLDGLGK